MTTHTLRGCASRAACPRRRAKPSLGARAASLALAIAALIVMSYGERWMLGQTPPTAGNELAAATYAIDVVYGDGAADDGGAQMDSRLESDREGSR